MKSLMSVCLLAGALTLPATGAYARDCSGLPTQFTGNEFPNGNFITNFNNSCYLIPFASGNGAGGEQGDTNTLYNKIYFTINPNLPPYEIVVLGQFPNSRYFSIGLYDNHSAITEDLSDVQIVPLSSSDINPYQPGVAFVSGQRYGLEIKLGGTPGTLEKGCMMTGYNVESNVMDGTLRHPFNNWNLNASFFHQSPSPVLHEVDTPQHSSPNTAGAILIRSYLSLTVPTAATQPHVIVRDVASGCAYPAAYVMSTMNVVSNNATTGNAWLNQVQVQEHNVYANWQTTSCWGTIPYSRLQWLRSAEYTSGANPDSSYLYAYVPAGLPQSLSDSHQVLRLRFRAPTTPPTPCTNGCSRSGNEQMRYMSVSFQVPGGATLASVADSCPANPVNPCIPLTQDANGYVTLVVSTGTAQPSWVTPANGYTWLDLSKGPNYLQLNQIAIRHILPASTFDCAAQVVPYKTGEATAAAAGLMGLYSPWVDYPVAANLPSTASALTGPDSCSLFPAGPPAPITSTSQVCKTLPAPTVTISAVTTQCAQPGCNAVVVQPQPPISILGTGFGSFPLGLPYTGNSNFIQITDTTQNWTAGYTGSPCDVSIGEWSGGLVSVLANVNQNGVCPMAAGDQLHITVWNPQTLGSASYSATVAAPAASRQ